MLAAMADRRLMADGKGRIGVPEVLVGLPFPAGPLEIMRFVVRPPYLAEVVYGGATYEPPDALERGLVDRVEAESALLERSIEEAIDLTRGAAEAFRLTKLQIRHPILENMRSNERAYDDQLRTAWTDPHTLGAIRDYVNRTFKAGA